LANKVTPPEQRAAAQQLREMLATFRQSEDLINLGAYASGSNPKLDQAIELRPRLLDFLRQPPDRSEPIETTLKSLYALAEPVKR
jgi:flagellar biosynthesis/type III secretory pathway ATPase